MAHEVLGEQIKLDAAIEVLGPLLDRSLGAENLPERQVRHDGPVARRLPDAAPVDDTMLISYAQEAGLHGHGLDELSQLHLGHTPISYDEVTGTGRNRLPFAQVQIDRATAHARRGLPTSRCACGTR